MHARTCAARDQTGESGSKAGPHLPTSSLPLLRIRPEAATAIRQHPARDPTPSRAESSSSQSPRCRAKPVVREAWDRPGLVPDALRPGGPSAASIAATPRSIPNRRQTLPGSNRGQARLDRPQRARKGTLRRDPAGRPGNEGRRPNLPGAAAAGARASSRASKSPGSIPFPPDQTPKPHVHLRKRNRENPVGAARAHRPALSPSDPTVRQTTEDGLATPANRDRAAGSAGHRDGSTGLRTVLWLSGIR